jgi:ABC-type cobalamin/Fe3+-siderophores transport system ATPase subunit
MQSPLIEAQNLGVVGSDGQMLLHAICFSCAPRERIAVVGPNGAGKTTLARTITGLSPQYHGSLCVGETGEIRSIAPAALSRIVSYVPQRVDSLPYFSVEEFIQLSGGGSGFEELRDSLSPLYKRKLPQLSGGELQRVLLAGAIVQGAQLIVLDEPTASLDPRGRGEVRELLMNTLQQMNIACVLVTHDISLAVHCCERVIVMKGGRILADLAANSSELTATLEAAYECRRDEFR